MPSVPIYQRTNEKVRPIQTQDFGNRAATPDAFGASIGRGLQEASNGLSAASAAIAAVQQRDELTRAQNADIARRKEEMAVLYDPEKGYFSKTGQAAIDAQKDTQRQLDEIAKRNGQGLTGDGARAYQTASGAARVAVDTSILQHAGKERKAWYNETAVATAQQAANEALTSFAVDGDVDMAIGRGMITLRDSYREQGMPQAEIDNKLRDYESGIRKNVILRHAVDDPLTAQKKLDEWRPRMTGAHQYDLDHGLEGEIKKAQARQFSLDILGTPRKFGADPTSDYDKITLLESDGGRVVDTKGRYSGPAQLGDQVFKEVGMTRSDDPAVQREAWGKYRDKTIVPRLTKLYPGVAPDQAPFVATALMQINGPSGGEALIRAARDNPSALAAEVVGKAGEGSPLQAIDGNLPNAATLRRIGAPSELVSMRETMGDAKTITASQYVAFWDKFSAYKTGGTPSGSYVDGGGAPERQSMSPYRDPNSGRVTITGSRLAVWGEDAKVRTYLAARLSEGHDGSHIDGMDAGFARGLAAMFQDAPPDVAAGLAIGSGARTVERQNQIFRDKIKERLGDAAVAEWDAAVTAKGYAGAAEAMRPKLREAGVTAEVAPPGQSNHNFGRAADLSYNGVRLDKAPANVVAWVHNNAPRYGLHFPLPNEDWHVEPTGSRQGAVNATGTGVAPRSTYPSEAEIEQKLAAIPDEETRELTRQRIKAAITADSAAQEARQKQAKQELWRLVDSGKTPDDAPMEIRQTAGQDAVSSAWSYIKNRDERNDVDDDMTIYALRREAASNPATFSRRDLNDFRDRMSRSTYNEMTKLQADVLKDTREAKEKGADYMSVYKQAEEQLAAAGLSMEALGKNPGEEKKLEMRKRLAAFQLSLTRDIDYFRQKNGKNPDPTEAQRIIDRKLMPIILETPGGGWFGRASTRDAFAFDADTRGQNEIVRPAAPNVILPRIPVDLRQAIVENLASRKGKPPTDQEIVDEYLRVVNTYR